MFVNPTNHPIFIPIAINRRGARCIRLKYNPPPLYFLSFSSSPRVYASFHWNHRFHDLSVSRKIFPTKPKCTTFSWNGTRYRFFSRNHLKNELIIRLYDRGRKVVREEFRSLGTEKKKERKKGGKNLKFLFPEKRTVYEKGGQGWTGQIKFCLAVENCFFVGAIARCSRTTDRHKMVAAMWKWSSQRARFLVGRQSVRVFVSAAAPKLFAPTGRYASLIARAVNKRGAEKERKELLRAISWPRRKVVPSAWPFRKKFHARNFPFRDVLRSAKLARKITVGEQRWNDVRSQRKAAGTQRISLCSLSIFR